ncbi:MAG: hypothetical protein JST00_41640 [Deltaproteobacteria bacterium]|nr:hypothetical protein [Deltaproteobacteria bacterium]
MKRLFLSLGALTLLSFSTGCSSTLSQPFEAMKQQPITVYRLQNFEPPAAAAAGAPQMPAGIPPQIQQWLSAGAQLLPPGLLPPGLLPGGTPAPTADANVPRFHNFRILGSMAVTDKTQHDDILAMFGKESSFELPRQSCMYAEFGFQIGGAGGPTVQGAPPAAGAPADILVSLSCDQVQMFNYSWPYGTKNGLSDETSRKIVALVQKAFGG